MIMDILNYLIALATLFFGYRIYLGRKEGKKFSEIKPVIISFFACVVLLWAITVYTAFFNY